MDLMNVLSEAEIRGLLIRERFYRDTSQWKQLRHCYHPDASLTVIDISWYRGDIDGFVRESAKMAQRGTLATHAIQPVDITVHGSKAFAQSICTISTRFTSGKAGAEYDLVSHCRLLSRLQQVPINHDSHHGPAPSKKRKLSSQFLSSPPDTAWKMLSMEIIYMQDSILPAIPPTIVSEQLGLLKPGDQDRKSYRFLSWVMKQKGYEINDRLPGTDKPEMVKELLEKNDAWVLP